MNLTKTLRKQSYDLIEGPIRNHNLLQLWLKKIFNEVDFYYSNIDYAFKSNVKLNEIKNDALTVNASTQNEYEFNIGLSLLREILNSIGMGNLDLSTEIKSGKKLRISFDNSITKEIPIGEIENYLSRADFQHPNRTLLRNANRNNILVISGVLCAKNLIVEIDTKSSVNSSLLTKLNTIASGDMTFSKLKTNTLKMESSGTDYFPIAVKAHRIDFDKGNFDRTILVTDNRNFF